MKFGAKLDSSSCSRLRRNLDQVETSRNMFPISLCHRFIRGMPYYLGHLESTALFQLSVVSSCGSRCRRITWPIPSPFTALDLTPACSTRGTSSTPLHTWFVHLPLFFCVSLHPLRIPELLRRTSPHPPRTHTSVAPLLTCGSCRGHLIRATKIATLKLLFYHCVWEVTH